MAESAPRGRLIALDDIGNGPVILAIVIAFSVVIALGVEPVAHAEVVSDAGLRHRHKAIPQIVLPFGELAGIVVVEIRQVAREGALPVVPCLFDGGARR